MKPCFHRKRQKTLLHEDEKADSYPSLFRAGPGLRAGAGRGLQLSSDFLPPTPEQGAFACCGWAGWGQPGWGFHRWPPWGDNEAAAPGAPPSQAHPESREAALVVTTQV